MYRQWFLTMVCLLVITQMLAQTETQEKGRVVVVADMETRRPIRDVLVYLDNGDYVKLDWTCRFKLYHHKFKRATFSHPDYLKRVMDSQELTVDTVFLIPLCQTLSEVIVTAKAPKINPVIGNKAQEVRPENPRGIGELLGFFQKTLSPPHTPDKQRAEA